MHNFYTQLLILKLFGAEQGGQLLDSLYQNGPSVVGRQLRLHVVDRPLIVGA
jgi:hypothetical protein